MEISISQILGTEEAKGISRSKFFCTKIPSEKNQLQLFWWKEALKNYYQNLLLSFPIKVFNPLIKGFFGFQAVNILLIPIKSLKG